MQNRGRLKPPPHAVDQLGHRAQIYSAGSAEINLPRDSTATLALGFGEKTETATPCCRSTRLAQYGAAPGGDQSPGAAQQR